MTRLTTKQLRDIAEWCREHHLVPSRVTGADLSAACLSLGIAQDCNFKSDDIKEIASLTEADHGD